MPAGSGTATFPTQAGESLFNDAAGGVISIAVGLFAGADIKQLDKAVQKLYEEANYLAVRFVELVVAELWWAAHLGTATSELAGLLDEAGQHAEQAAADQLAAWREFLEVKYPADLHNLYNLLHTKHQHQQKVNLAPILAAIKRLQADDRKEQRWQANIATPELNRWIRFYAVWRTTYLPPLRTLIDWLKHPAHLSAFILPSVVSGLPSELRRKRSRGSAGSISLALLATWQDNPDQALSLILDWLVTG